MASMLLLCSLLSLTFAGNVSFSVHYVSTPLRRKKGILKNRSRVVPEVFHRCAEYGYDLVPTPIICTMNEIKFNIWQQIDHNNRSCKYKASLFPSGQKEFKCEMQFIPTERALNYKVAFAKQRHIQKLYSKKYKGFNLVHYFYASDTKKFDESYILITKNYEGNLQKFGIVYNHELHTQHADVHEAVAVQSFCDLLQNISIPLHALGFGAVSMENVVAHKRIGIRMLYDFYLSNMEDQFIEKDDEETIRRLTWLGWQWYSKICNAHITLDALDSGRQRTLPNIFCSKS